MAATARVHSETAAVTERSEVTPLAASAVVLDTPQPTRMDGRYGYGMLSGQFVSASAAGSAALYADALSVVSGHFQTTPPPRIVLTNINGTTLWGFIAMGRAV
jgi:hypothetical protein